MSPLSHPSCTWYRGGERQHEAPHSFRLLHETPRPDTQFTFSGLRCQLQLFASRTSVNRCITDGNGAALQLVTINVSTWILINLQNSIYPTYYTFCYRESYESSPGDQYCWPIPGSESLDQAGVLSLLSDNRDVMWFAVTKALSAPDRWPVLCLEEFNVGTPQMASAQCSQWPSEAAHADHTARVVFIESPEFMVFK